MGSRSEVRVSYILTTMNRAAHLDDALSRMGQLVQNSDELIVIDGASTDETQAVIAKHQPRIDVFLTEPDRGEAHGLNKGLMMARGEFIKFVTDDDEIFPKAMSLAIETLQQHPDVDAILCGGEQYRVDPRSGKEELVGYQCLPEHATLATDPLQLFRTIQCGVGLVFRRRIVPLVGLLDTSFRAVDTDYMFRLLERRVNFRYLNIKLYRHNDLPHSGMNLVDECHRDRLRILARTGRWNEFMNEHDYSPQLIGDVLGVNRLAHGRAAMIAILEVERLRRSRFGWFLVPLAHTLRIVGAVGRRVMIPFRALGSMDSLQTAEPDWDGALR